MNQPHIYIYTLPFGNQKNGIDDPICKAEIETQTQRGGIGRLGLTLYLRGNLLLSFRGYPFTSKRVIMLSTTSLSFPFKNFYLFSPMQIQLYLHSFICSPGCFYVFTFGKPPLLCNPEVSSVWLQRQSAKQPFLPSSKSPSVTGLGSQYVPKFQLSISSYCFQFPHKDIMFSMILSTKKESPID